jgi:hypothetical protein
MPPQAILVCDHSDSVNSSDRTGLVRSKKRVRIELEYNIVFDVPHIDDMSDADVAAIWYEKQDYELMKQSFIPVIKKLMRGAKVEESNNETARGLEFRTRDGAMQRQKNKIQSVQTVLDEQDRQFSVGLYDVEKISELYATFAQPCLILARDLAVEDENFVKANISLSSDDDGKQKKVSGLRNMIRQVRRSSLTWKSSRSLASEKSYLSDKSTNPAAE